MHKYGSTNMAATRQAFQSAPHLQPFIIPNVRATGKKLGVGSYGSVEEVDVNGLICAGKKIHNTLIEEGFQGVQDIARKYVEECRLMSDLRHPHIVQFMGVCFLLDSSLPVLVMERLLMSLDDLLEDTPDVPLALKRSILADVCKGLVYLHDRNSPIIHRDLSAKNVLLDSNMVAKISDLGNARIVEFQQAQTLSRNPGTQIYMPPEALYGPPGCDPRKSRYGTRIDIFSLGHLALFAVTQVYPKDLLPHNYPDPQNPRRLLGRTELERREDYVIQLHQKLGKNHSLVKLIERCLDNDPAQRPTASEALCQLEGMRSQITDPYLHLNKVEMMKLLGQLQLDNSALKAELDRSKARIDRLLEEKRVLQADNSARHRVPVPIRHQYDVVPDLPRRGSENTLAAQADHHEHVQSYPQQPPVLARQHLHSQQPLGQSQSAFQTPVQGAHQQPSAYPQPAELHSQQPDKPELPQLHHQLSIGSTVQLSNPPVYGVIRWIGELPGVNGMIAGVELEADLNGCTDGTWHRTGMRYFDCPPERGMFCPLRHLRPDHRFTVPGAVPGSAVMKNPLDSVPYTEVVDQPIHGHQFKRYLGEGRGIQGHQNSCYLDATVFGLFALSDVFDYIFLMEPDSPAGKEVRTLFWIGIVNPLRKNGVVRFESVMGLRSKLEELGKMKGVNQDEKDPEQFLNMLLKHALDVKPFISIKRPFGVEQEYFVQLFLEYDEQMKLPTVEDLLRKMFTEQDISFTRVPSKLLIRVPKQYKKIVPALELDISKLIHFPQSCHVCGQSARIRCSWCTEVFKSEDSYIYFCGQCSEVTHKHSERSNHQIEKPEEFEPTELELLSVICIETSHYVCFSRSEEKWIFFDSMANRLYNLYNVPKGVECTRELNEWVYSGDRQRLMDTPPRKLPEYVRRFTQDIYMCVYSQPYMGMYDL